MPEHAHYVWSDITRDQAAELVRQFTGDPDLVLTYEGIGSDEDIYTAPWHFGQNVMHKFSSGYRNYAVSVRDPFVLSCGDVTPIYDPEGYYGQPFDEWALKARQMPLEEAQARAEAFLAAHHPDAASLTLLRSIAQPTTGTEDGFAAYYSFMYAARLDNGAMAPSTATMKIDSVLGATVAYSQMAYPVLVDWHPTIDEQAAIDAAATALIWGDLGDAHIQALSVKPPDALGLERLAWQVYLTGYDNFGEAHHWTAFTVAVDAHTGEVIAWDTYLCGGSPPARSQPQRSANAPFVPPPQLLRSGKPLAICYPPVSVGGRHYLYLLNLPGLGAKMELLGPGRAALKTSKATFP